MGYHGFFHGALVFMVTGNWLFLLIEWVSHATIDWYKCKGRISFMEDQALHLLLKVVYAASFLITL